MQSPCCRLRAVRGLLRDYRRDVGYLLRPADFCGYFHAVSEPLISFKSLDGTSKRLSFKRRLAYRCGGTLGGRSLSHW